MTARRLAGDIGVATDGTSRVDTDADCDEQWRRVMGSFEDLSAYFGPTALHHFSSNTRALDICDALLHAEEPAAKRSPKVTARIQRTYTDPNGGAFAIIEHARGGEPARTTDAMVIAENCVNAWTRFIRKQRGAGLNYGA